MYSKSKENKMNMVSVPAVGSENSYARFIQTRTIEVLDILNCLEFAGDGGTDEWERERHKRTAVDLAMKLRRKYHQQ